LVVVVFFTHIVVGLCLQFVQQPLYKTKIQQDRLSLSIALWVIASLVSNVPTLLRGCLDGTGGGFSIQWMRRYGLARQFVTPIAGQMKIEKSVN